MSGGRLPEQSGSLVTARRDMAGSSAAVGFTQPLSFLLFSQTQVKGLSEQLNGTVDVARLLKRNQRELSRQDFAVVWRVIEG